MLSSLVSMPPCSMVRCPEEEGEGKTAFIDQRAVAAGKKFRIYLAGSVCVYIYIYDMGTFGSLRSRCSLQTVPNVKSDIIFEISNPITYLFMCILLI